MARKKKSKENKRAEAGSGERHDKHAESEGVAEHERAEPGSGEQHDKHAPTIGTELDEAQQILQDEAQAEVDQDEADAEAPDDENPDD